MRECNNSKIHISSNFILSICLIIMLDTFVPEEEKKQSRKTSDTFWCFGLDSNPQCQYAISIRWQSEYYLDGAVTVVGRYLINHVQICSGVNRVSHQINTEVWSRGLAAYKLHIRAINNLCTFVQVYCSLIFFLLPKPFLSEEHNFKIIVLNP